MIKKVEALKNVINNFVSLREEVIISNVYKLNEVKDYIVELNTEGQPTSQLYEQGVNSDGQQLGNYTSRSIFLKLTGTGDKKIDHITLKDTGEFYRSFKVEVMKNGFEIIANPLKPDNDLTDRFGKEIIGLSEQNKEILSNYLQPFILSELRKKLLD